MSAPSSLGVNFAERPVEVTPLWQPAVTSGFATSVAMWLVGFITHLPAVQAPPFVVGIILLATMAAAGTWWGAQFPKQYAVRCGVASGLVTASVNLLILGSLLASGERENELRPNWAIVLAGFFAFGGGVGGFTAWLGQTLRAKGSGDPGEHSWLARFSIVAVFAAVPVILSGGLVTSAKAGLAVPDWPNSFSTNMFLYPLAKMTGGVYYEHAHRLFGSLVGLTTLTLLVFTVIVDRRIWTKVLVGGVFGLVCFQGLIGGLRVTSATPTADSLHAATEDNSISLPLAMFHGISGQITFAALCGVAAVLSRRWIRSEDRDRVVDTGLSGMATATVVVLVMQLILGAASRHFQQLHALYSHAGFAVIVIAVSAMAGFRAVAACKNPGARPLKSLGHGVLHSMVLQVVLGLVALFLVLPYDGSPKRGPGLLFATLHQANGAALLGLATALWVWTRRLVITESIAAGEVVAD